MKSLKELYRVGKGPSSSHTMGPQHAAKIFAEEHTDAKFYEVTLYGSLAATGKGHMTDVAIEEILSPIAPLTILWEPQTFLPFHPNGMTFRALDGNKQITDKWTVYSVGGGALSEGKKQGDRFDKCDTYAMKSMEEITSWCYTNGRNYWEYVEMCEQPDIWDYLSYVWKMMQESVEAGLDMEGVLPGPLKLPRKAATYYVKAQSYRNSVQNRGLVYAYALAVSEQNARGGTVVTAPTCGSCGVVPAVLYHIKRNHGFSDRDILKALATAGLFGNIIKTNASISGAEVGCQGEVGSACVMAAVAANQLFGGSPQQIEYAAEMAMEHNLGLTCDPVCGLVQIPCIERNAMAAVRALDVNLYAMMSDGKHIISFDKVVETMNLTGKDLPSLYKETALGGLALTKG